MCECFVTFRGSVRMRGREFGIIRAMEKITTDISTFENLREDGYTYVDKTDKF